MAAGCPQTAQFANGQAVAAVNEETPLLAGLPDTNAPTIETAREESEPLLTTDGQENDAKISTASVWGILSVLLIGVFISQSDISIVLATYGQISSEFNQLQLGSWLLTSYMLTMCVSQPMYGKLSDIFGRKTALQGSYVLFTLGTAFCGLGTSMAQVIAGRAIQGFGAGGMVSVVSIIITDIVPLQDVAYYRSYANVAQTVGRSAGGAIGGYLTQVIGWRWTLLVQVPPTLLSIVLVWWKLDEPSQTTDQQQTHLTKIKRIDFAGILFLGGTILCGLLALEVGTTSLDPKDPVFIGLIVGTGCCGIVFGFIEARWAKEPVFPLHLLKKRAVATSYLPLALQFLIQISLMSIVPLYFQVTKGASTGQAGAALVPAIVGNTLGGLGTGVWIRRSGRYKLAMIISPICSLIAFSLVSTLWNRDPSWAKVLFIFPGGMASGMAHSASFVLLTAGVSIDEVAVAGAGLYLSGHIGTVLGLSGSAAILQAVVKADLIRDLASIPNGSKILERAISDVNYVRRLDGRVRQIVVDAYIDGSKRVFYVCLGIAGVALLISLATKENRLKR